MRQWKACGRVDGVEPLRVGLVSGDFKTHPVGFFLESVLAHIDPRRIALVAYSATLQEDALSARLLPSFTAWHSLIGVRDDIAARRIENDGIHLLLDLSGHTAHNRLPIFAWKPAPVQASWLGYWASTGVSGMDYLIADATGVPVSERQHFSEQVWYLPHTRLCFTAPSDSPRLMPTAPPALTNGYVTFACFQNITKVTDAVLAVWGRIFQALPQARLRLQTKQMEYVSAREKLLQRLSRAGIGRERVSLAGQMSREDYLAAHAEVDIILDTFPYTGATTSCEALWMGVPMVSLTGQTMLARQGASLLTCAGLADWVAIDENDYVAKALHHAGDLYRLAHLRAGLREQVLASPLFDAPRFARHLEDALEGMWQQKMGRAAR